MKDGAEILGRVMTERDRICEIAARHGARNIRIFGSVARGEAKEESAGFDGEDGTAKLRAEIPVSS